MLLGRRPLYEAIKLSLVLPVQAPKHPQPLPLAIVVPVESEQGVRRFRGEFAGEEVKMWG